MIEPKAIGAKVLVSLGKGSGLHGQPFCVVAENSLSNFLVGETNSQRESLGASAVSRPCFLTCRNKEARFGTRIPESIEGKQRNAPPKKR